jgi:spore coat protein U-like protein
MAARAAVLSAALLWLGAARPASADCSVRVVSNVAFGTYNVFSATPLDSVGQVRWRCSGVTFPQVRITIDRGRSSTFLPRRMYSGANPLDYNLYLDAARQQVWGDESPGTQAYYQQYWGFGWVTLNVFGRVPASQDAAVGSYRDDVAVVINW